jgi:hypothetical protein
MRKLFLLSLAAGLVLGTAGLAMAADTAYVNIHLTIVTNPGASVSIAVPDVNFGIAINAVNQIIPDAIKTVVTNDGGVVSTWSLSTVVDGLTAAASGGAVDWTLNEAAAANAANQLKVKGIFYYDPAGTHDYDFQDNDILTVAQRNCTDLVYAADGGVLEQKGVNVSFIAPANTRDLRFMLDSPPTGSDATGNRMVTPIVHASTI